MAKEEGLYSVAQYQGARKWCFAIAANRALDNCQQRPTLFVESLLRYERATQRDWFDEETRALIKQANAPERLRKIRNYFSHYSHDATCLNFAPGDDLRRIMEKAYEKAVFEVRKRFTKETDIEPPNLFEPSAQITAAGVVFFCSFFVERRILNRLMGYIRGFKKTEGEYAITRRIFSTYCLRDSHSIKAGDPNAVLFRDILGYLSRVPAQYYRHHKDACDKAKHPERKTDKFIDLALRYLEILVFPALQNGAVCVGRKQIVREEGQRTEEKEGEHRPYPPKAKVKVVLGQHHAALPYYINHNTVILQTGKQAGTVHSCKIGVNELKYLVLLCLQGKAKEAIEKIDAYVHRIGERFADASAHVRSDENKELLNGLPEFMRIAGAIDTRDTDRELDRRLEYIRRKWKRKKAESDEAELQRKGRDILRYVNSECARPLGVEQYNQFLGLLVNRDLRHFQEALKELKRTGLIPEQVLKSLEDMPNLNALHAKVCDLVLAKLNQLQKDDPPRLKHYIGVLPKEEKEPPSYEDKVKAFVQQPMLYKGFLRETLFQEAVKRRQTSAKLVEETPRRKAYPDVPLGKDRYFARNIEEDERKNRFHKDNATLYETLALDRLCVMIARACFERLNKDLSSKSQSISWAKTGEKETICLTFPRRDRPSDKFEVRFAVADYAKLYVMDDAEFLGALMSHFFEREQSLDYHRLYSDGIHHYTSIQKEGIEALLNFEEKIITNKSIRPSDKGYIDFNGIVAHCDYPDTQKDLLKKIRNSLLHYQLKFKPTDWRKFVKLMTERGFWSKNKKRKAPGK